MIYFRWKKIYNNNKKTTWSRISKLRFSFSSVPTSSFSCDNWRRRVRRNLWPDGPETSPRISNVFYGLIYRHACQHATINGAKIKTLVYWSSPGGASWMMGYWSGGDELTGRPSSFPFCLSTFTTGLDQVSGTERSQSSWIFFSLTTVMCCCIKTIFKSVVYMLYNPISS